MTLVELYQNFRGDLQPLSSSQSQAFECLVVGLVNHFQYSEFITPILINDFLRETWTPAISMALVNSPTCDDDKRISWNNWKAFFTYMIRKRLYDNSRANRIDLEDEETCEVEGCFETPNEWDHIWPHSFGGPNEKWNYMHMCKLHNRMKSSSLQMFSYLLLEDENYYSSFYYWLIEQEWYLTV